MRDLTSLQLAREMSPGLNLGNTLEALPSETAWGNPPANQAVMNAFKAAGFKTVRIPVAWNQYADAEGNISPAWMARVTEVVNHARNAGLYVLINTHWDGGGGYPPRTRIRPPSTRSWRSSGPRSRTTSRATTIAFCSRARTR